MENRTTLVISHRLSFIKNADVIVVMHEGKIVEQGTHDTLMKKKGHYYNLVRQQEKKTKDEALDSRASG